MRRAANSFFEYLIVWLRPGVVCEPVTPESDVVVNHINTAMNTNSWGRMLSMAALSLPVILDLADCIANAITQDLGDPLAAA